MTAQAEQLLLFNAQELGDPQEDVIFRFLSKHGPSFLHWQYRFARFWKRGATMQAKVAFLKGEFGIGGRSITTPHEDVNAYASWSAKGMEIEYKSQRLSFTRKLSWAEVAKRFDEIIASWTPPDHDGENGGAEARTLETRASEREEAT